MSYKAEKTLNLFRHHLVSEIDNLGSEIRAKKAANDYSYGDAVDKREFLIDELITLTRIGIGVEDEHLALIAEAMEEERKRDDLRLPWDEEEGDIDE